MTTLRGANFDPNSPGKLVDVLAGGVDEAMLREEKALRIRERDKYRRFLKTNVGRAVADLAEPMLRRIDELLRMSEPDLRVNAGEGYTDLKEVRSNLRGKAEVWAAILHYPEEVVRLSEEIKTIEKVLEKEETT